MTTQEEVRSRLLLALGWVELDKVGSPEINASLLALRQAKQFLTRMLLEAKLREAGR